MEHLKELGRILDYRDIITPSFLITISRRLRPALTLRTFSIIAVSAWRYHPVPRATINCRSLGHSNVIDALTKSSRIDEPRLPPLLQGNPSSAPYYRESINQFNVLIYRRLVGQGIRAGANPGTPWGFHGNGREYTQIDLPSTAVTSIGL